MADIGKRQKLIIEDQGENGLMLEGGVVLPFDKMPETWDLGDEVDVFVYQTSEGVVTATSQDVFVEVGRCAKLTVVDVNKVGAFMDMGLEKDLLVPFKEQDGPMRQGRDYWVYVYLDGAGRITATRRLAHKVPEVDYDDTFGKGQEVELLIAAKTDIGYKAVVDGTHLGLIHFNEVLEDLFIGNSHKGWVQSIRDDGKLNLTLIPKTKELQGELADKIIAFLKDNNGSMTLTDKSDAGEIRRAFGCSKGAFKKALGKLYKARLVTLSKENTTLN